MKQTANYLSTGIKFFLNVPNPFSESIKITGDLNAYTHVKLAVNSCFGDDIMALDDAFRMLVNTILHSIHQDYRQKSTSALLQSLKSANYR
jgi:hypothetical protein